MPISAARFAGLLTRSFARGVHAEVELIRSREATTVPSHPPGSRQGLCRDGEVAQSSVLGSPNREFRDLAWVFDDRVGRLEGDSLGHIGVDKRERELLPVLLPLDRPAANPRNTTENVSDYRPVVLPLARPAALAGIADRDGFRLAGLDEGWQSVRIGGRGRRPFV